MPLCVSVGDTVLVFAIHFWVDGVSDLQVPCGSIVPGFTIINMWVVLCVCEILVYYMSARKDRLNLSYF